MWSIGNGRLVTPQGVVDDGLVAVEGGTIAYAGPRAGAPEAVAGRVPEVNAGGGWICPGFIDVHVHGGGGADVMDGEEAALQTVARSHARHGTTGLLATTMTAPHRQLVDIAKTVARVAGQAWSQGPKAADGGPPEARDRGARILGLHLEGPYVNTARAGAQNPAHMRPPTRAELDELLAAAGPHWRRITLAPELPGALEAIAHLARRGVAVSLGHTAAGFAQARQAVAAGARSITHAFNAMNGLHHREPGLLGAALADEGVWTELIADGLHVHPVVMGLLYKLKGAARVVLVTDSMRAQGCGDGEYTLGDLPVVVRGLEARLQTDDPNTPGPLAGSVLTMDGAVRRMVQDVGVPLVEAIAMASRNPAALIGLQDRKGALAKGYDADIVVLDPSLHTQLTVVEGLIVYRR